MSPLPNRCPNCGGKFEKNERGGLICIGKCKKPYVPFSTTELPEMDKRIPRSSIRLEVEGTSVIAVPTMRVVATLPSRELADVEADRLGAQLAEFRLDMLRPYGTCPACAKPKYADGCHYCV